MNGIKTCSCPNPNCSEPTGELSFKRNTCGTRSEVTVLGENGSRSQEMLQIVLGIGEMECLELVKWWVCMRLYKWLCLQ